MCILFLILKFISFLLETVVSTGLFVLCKHIFSGCLLFTQNTNPHSGGSFFLIVSVSVAFCPIILSVLFMWMKWWKRYLTWTTAGVCQKSWGWNLQRDEWFSLPANHQLCNMCQSMLHILQLVTYWETIVGLMNNKTLYVFQNILLFNSSTHV